MLKLIKTNSAILAIIIIMATGLNSCGEKTMIPNSLIHDFGHKLPEGFRESYDLTSDNLGALMDHGILFWGQSIRDANANTFDIGVQFYSETEGRKIYVEKLVLDTPNLKTERVVNDAVEIDKLGKKSKLYFKRILPFEDISGDSIPLTADFFTLRIDYKLDENPTKQMSIRFDNSSFVAPNF